MTYVRLPPELSAIAFGQGPTLIALVVSLFVAVSMTETALRDLGKGGDP